MKRLYYFIRPYFVVFGIMTSLLLSCTSSKQEEASSQTRPGKIQNVEVVNPQLRSFSAEILVTGTARPNQRVMLYAMESGYVRDIRRDIGDRVTKGEVIAYLENPMIAQLVSDAQAAVSSGESEVLIAKSEMVAAQAQAKNKTLIFDRLHNIYQRTPALTSLAEVENAEAESATGTAMIKTMEARLAARQGMIPALQQRLRTAQARAGALQLRAPFSATLTNRFVDKGAMVQSGLNNSNPQALVELQELDPIRLTIPLPEADAVIIKKGAKALISFPELPGATFDAMVSRLGGALDMSSKTMQIELDIANPEGQIISGMYAKALLKLESREEVYSLPVTTQVLFQDEPFILMVEDSVVIRVPLRKGLASKDYFEVLNGEIKAASMIIEKGKGLVSEGQTVNPILKQE